MTIIRYNKNRVMRYFIFYEVISIKIEKINIKIKNVIVLINFVYYII